ncbi:ribosome maturation factor RimP [bacterium]|nr:ribosome maturation factor RimP [bacterium]
MPRGLDQLLREEVREAGFELYDWSLKAAGKRGRLLQVSIHSDKGVNLDQCAAVSRTLGRALEAEDLIEGRYILEVSSPGMDRPLMSPRHYEIARGRIARVQHRQGENASRTLEGEVLGLEGSVLVLKSDEAEERIPLAEIDRARLVPQFPGRKRKSAGPTGGKKK